MVTWGGEEDISWSKMSQNQARFLKSRSKIDSIFAKKSIKNIDFYSKTDRFLKAKIGILPIFGPGSGHF